MKRNARFESGLSWRTVTAILYAISVFQAAAIFIYLMTANIALMSGIQWATLLLFVELSRLYGKPLSRQEASVIFLGSSLVGQFMLFTAWTGGGLQMGLLYQGYLKFSPITASYGLADQIPSFYSPTEEAWITRTFFDPSWIPILITTSIFWVCAFSADLSLTFILYRLYIQEENLPFPTARPIAEACTTFVEESEKSRERLRLMAVFATISLIYSLILYGIPFIQLAYGYEFQPIPVPWVDFNKIIHQAFPGVSLGVATDLAIFTTGLIIPFSVCVAMFIGSFAIYFLGNFLLVTFGFTEFAKEWAFGMPISSAWQRSMMHAWACPLIGMSIAAGLMPLIRRPKALIATFKTLIRPRATKSGFALSFPLVIFMAATIGLTIYGHLLSPDFPIWILLLLNVGWSFISALIMGRALGVAMPFSIPYARELVLVASGYQGYDIWFTPVYAAPSTFLLDFKICELTHTNPLSYIKTWLLLLPVAYVFGILLTQNFWSMQPIPSFVYPGVDISWPVTNTLQLLFVARAKEFFRPMQLVYGFIVAAVLYFILDLFHISRVLIGVAIGGFSAIPMTLTILMGALFGRTIEYILGKKWWSDNAPIMAAGLILGEGVTLVIATAISMIMKSLWMLPY